MLPEFSEWFIHPQFYSEFSKLHLCDCSLRRTIYSHLLIPNYWQSSTENVKGRPNCRSHTVIFCVKINMSGSIHKVREGFSTILHFSPLQAKVFSYTEKETSRITEFKTRWKFSDAFERVRNCENLKLGADIHECPCYRALQLTLQLPPHLTMEWHLFRWGGITMTQLQRSVEQALVNICIWL